MQDVFGTELNVGDVVAYTRPGYHYLDIGVVISLSPKGARVIDKRSFDNKVPMTSYNTTSRRYYQMVKHLTTI